MCYASSSSYNSVAGSELDMTQSRVKALVAASCHQGYSVVLSPPVPLNPCHAAPIPHHTMILHDYSAAYRLAVTLACRTSHAGQILNVTQHSQLRPERFDFESRSTSQPLLCGTTAMMLHVCRYTAMAASRITAAALVHPVRSCFPVSLLMPVRHCSTCGSQASSQSTCMTIWSNMFFPASTQGLHSVMERRG